MGRQNLLRGGLLPASAALLCCWLLLSPLNVSAAEFNFSEGTCATGREQSPIEIPVTDAVESSCKGTLQFDYRVFIGATVANTGHGAQVNVAPGNYFTAAGERWELLQFHFHTPSEHTLGGRHSAMEAHLVHKHADTGALAVVGVLLDPEFLKCASEQKRCSALDQALQYAPTTEGDVSGPQTLRTDTFTSLIPGSSSHPTSSNSTRHHRDYSHVSYNGSLTTPPCTEGLSWYVLLDGSAVAADQVLQFQRLVGNGTTLGLNSRPVQDLNGRTFGCSHG